MGGLPAREEGLFARLPPAPTVSHDEVLAFVRRRRLARRGIGWIDAHLLASALASEGALWTVDGELAAAAKDLGVGYGGS
jgi:predicted nucleic acid-binding protein